MERDLSARHYDTVERAIGFIHNNVSQRAMTNRSNTKGDFCV